MPGSPFPRLLTIATPLGEDALIPLRLSVGETLGLPFRIEVDVVSDQHELKASDLLTKQITVTVTQVIDDSPIERHFNGLVAEFQRTGPGVGGKTGYRLVAVPGIWRLGLARNCRVFQAKTVKQIVTAVLAEHDQPTPEWGILPTLEALPYCTQFNETDLHFVSRLLEEHGITYYFTHTAAAHKLCISATAPGFPAFAGSEVKVVHGSRNAFEFSSWRHANHARSASDLFLDMDGEISQPSVVQTKQSTSRTYTGEPAMWAAGKVFRWPGGMATRPGVDPAAIVIGGLETASEAFVAESIDPRFAAGVRVSVALKAEDDSAASSQYVVTGVSHTATDNSGLAAGSGGNESYGSSLELVASGRAWMPEARHARPVMSGLYSAKVTGPSGEKIHVDEFGRVKVKFRWDRSDANDDTTSCWVRVAQSAAGSWGGTWFLPRVGDEVMVAFLDADPDRPVVTGSVYGKDAKPPFLPATNRAQSGIRTRSYKSDSAEDANIFRFEDKKDSEEVFLHAQKDLKVEVENDETRTIDHDQTETIKNARTVTVKESHDTLTVEQGNRVVTVKVGNDTHTVETGNRAVTVKTGNDSTTVEKGDRSADIKKGNETLTVNTGNEVHAIKSGDFSLKCDLGNVTIEAMQKITLKVGQNTVVIDQSGVTVKGLLIKEEAQGIHSVKGAMVKQEGSGMVQVQGGIVMIN